MSDNQNYFACQHIDTIPVNHELFALLNSCPVGKQKIKVVLSKNNNNVLQISFLSPECKECCIAEYSCSNVFITKNKECPYQKE